MTIDTQLQLLCISLGRTAPQLERQLTTWGDSGIIENVM